MLDSVRIVDFSRVLSGPFCTALLSDIGAEVVKVESPRGDDYRHIAPRIGDESAYFLSVNRNKKSVVIDLKTESGLRQARELVSRSDVLVENFRPGVAERLGLGYQALSATNPRLIYASISGFGQDGPLAKRPAYDMIIQAMSGIMEVTGAQDGPPTVAGEPIADLAAGLYAAWAISTALYHRERTGLGQCIDVAMFDALFSFNVSSLVQYLYTDKVPRRVGNRHPVSAPFGVFTCRDGHATIAVLNDEVFARLMTATGQPELAGDIRFSNDIARSENEPQLREIIEAWSSRRSVDEVVSALVESGVPAGPIWNIEQAIESGQVAARGLLVETEHPTLGRVRVARQPVQFSALAERQTRPPPGLGEHNELFLQPGLSDREELTDEQ